MGSRLVLATLLLFTAASASGAVDLALLGSWAAEVEPEGPGAGAAGAAGGRESSADEVVLSIHNTRGPNDAWRLDVRRSDTKWTDHLTLWVKVTSAGTGEGSVNRRAHYQEITTGDTPLCSGTGDRNGVCIQLRLTGMSPEVPPDRYLSSIVYTVVDES
ncbi:MAG: hypothetical protein GF355_11205 [Candidatus Eisenbacteria bacterium]|nr:hypothetical protein [Candidatus Eisenbacteria bacterium]